MLEDLIFKGKNLDDALAKAGNFYGAAKAGLQYEILEDSPEGEVWIRLTEQPAVAPGDSHQPADEERKARPPYRMSTEQRQDARPPQQISRGTRKRAGERFQAPRKERAQNRRPSEGGRGRESRWERSTPDLSGLSPVEREAYNFVVDILRRMHMRLDVQPVLDQSRLIFNIEGPDRSLLLNKKGSVLTSIQYLVNKIFMNREEKPQKIFVDSKGYRVAREEELREIALLGAEKVRSSKREYCLSPMNPYERRLIHLALRDEADVSTISRGDGYIKRVTIVPGKSARTEAEPEGPQGPRS